MTFHDTKQRQWTIRLDFGLLRTIRDAAQIDLGHIEKLAETWALLLYDDDKALHVLWLSIARTAEANSVTRDDFIASMDGEALQEALAALGSAIESFTQPRKRGMAERAIRGVSEGMAKAIAQAEAEIEKVLSQETGKALSALGT